MVQAPKSGQNQGQSGVFLWSANYTPSGPQINRPGFLHQPSLGVTRTANENHHLVKMERPHLMDGGHGYYLPYHAGEEHIETSVWFPVVQLDVNGHKASALLDICSTGCYIDSNFARKLGLEPVTDSCNIETLSGASSCTNKYDFSFSKDENSYKIQCYGVNNIPVPCPNIDIKSFKHLRNLPLEVIRTGSVDLLLGSNLGDILKPLEVRYSERKNEPYAIRTALGWCVCGTTGSSFSKIKSKNFVYVTNKQQDNPTLTDFKALWNVDQDIGQDIYESADENKCLPASKFMADQRLKSLVKRLNKHGLYQIYNEEVETLLNKGFAEHVVEKTIPQAVWYIPHHFVPKKGNKIRIVYDCAAQVEGRSINTEVLQGPDLNNTLLGVLLRFRLYPFAAMGDIEAMYMQVKVPPSQRDLIRFLWCNSDGSNIKSYRMTSHIFGGVWSPAAALFALQHCATFSNDKRVKGIILKSFYVDDMLASFQSLQKMKTVVNNVVEHLGGFGFNLRDILFNVSEVDRQSKISFHGALGLKWHNSVDMLSIVEITKRSILSTVAGVFDPLGLTSPGRTDKIKILFNIPVTVSPHSSLNYSKGVIRSRELKDCSETELLQELESQGITSVKKISISKNGKRITTGTIILTFNSPEPPKAIKAAYLNVSVDRYIPNPLRCFKCQKFGHHQTSCKHNAVCGKCGDPNHSDDGCEKTPCCVNCKGKHPSYSRECPNFILEKKIVTHKYNNNTTFPEARKMVLSLISTTSYARVTATNTKKDASTQTYNVGTQTDHVRPVIQTSCSASQTSACEVPPTETKINSNKKKNDPKSKPNVTKPQNKTEKQKESAIPTPTKNHKEKKITKTYERVMKPLTPAQLKLSTESVEFPPMDAIRSAAEAQEPSDSEMDFVTVTGSTKGKKGRPPKLPILPPT
ncbi:hypothetical protein GQR58_002026 [Nymphon striatum]|nr:hypothetical protein GQR58_002026 [Nymphon striatum]